MHLRFVLLLIGISLIPLNAALASLAVVDQQNTVGGTFINSAGFNTGPGQSFTPSLSSINAAQFSLSTGDGSAFTLRLDLFDGSGYGGALLGSSSPATVSGTNSQTIEFDFPSAIALTPGNVYTFRLTQTGAAGNSFYTVNDASSNPYAGGTLFDGTGTARAPFDLVFAEGTAAVPEPATTSLVTLGAVAALWQIRRRDSNPQG